MIKMAFTAYILDILTNSVYPARITIENGVFKHIIPIKDDNGIDVDVEGLMLPGFIDSHIHIESSKVTPAQFAKIAVRHGTTSVVCDPHEIANVCGIEGIEFMIENASQVPFNFYFTAPSCVPATSFETSGAVLDSSDVEYLLKKDEIVALGEMMNFPGVINGDEEVLKKLKEVSGERWKVRTKFLTLKEYMNCKNDSDLDAHSIKKIDGKIIIE